MSLEARRRVLQYRPRESADRRMYAPDRDLAYVAPAIIARVFEAFDTDAIHPDIKAAMDAGELSMDTVGDIAKRLSQFTRMVPDVDVADFSEAWLKSGLDSVPERARTLFLSQLGMTFLSACFISMRDVTPAAGDLPADAMQFVDAVDKLCRKLGEGGCREFEEKGCSESSAV